MNTLDRLSGARVLVVGDVMLDRYIIGRADRLSPESPVPVLLPGARRDAPGGAANVARNLADLGVDATLIGVVGDDEAGCVLRRMTGGSLVIDPSRSTTTKTRFLASGHQLLRMDEEDHTAISETIQETVMREIERAAPAADVLVISDYNKGVITPAVLKSAFIAMAGKHRIVDPKRPFLFYAGATILAPNTKELRDGTGVNDIDQAAALALAQSEAQALVVTRAEQGVSLFRPAQEAIHFAARAREVADVSGAGDTLVATLAGLLASGATLTDALDIANRAAGLVVGKRGTASVTQTELRDALGDTNGTRSGAKPLREALAIVRAWRMQGLRIGFTNGCFDLLHPGHVSLLRQARMRCDRLVVGLNTDASVRRLKGPSRPVQDERARGAVLSALLDVDLVVTFDEDTPLRLIETLEPDVLFKGADYRRDDIVGADVVEQRGGQVVIIPLADGHSTSMIVDRVNKGA